MFSGWAGGRTRRILAPVRLKYWDDEKCLEQSSAYSLDLGNSQGSNDSDVGACFDR